MHVRAVTQLNMNQMNNGRNALRHVCWNQHHIATIPPDRHIYGLKAITRDVCNPLNALHELDHHPVSI